MPEHAEDKPTRVGPLGDEYSVIEGARARGMRAVKIEWGSNSQFYWKNESGGFYLEACRRERAPEPQPAIPGRGSPFGWVPRAAARRRGRLPVTAPVNECYRDFATA